MVTLAIKYLFRLISAIASFDRKTNQLDKERLRERLESTNN